MSGQTYSTRIRVPTAAELVARAAEKARTQGVASGSAFNGEQLLAEFQKLNVRALRIVLDTAAPIAKPIAGTTHAIDTTSSKLEVTLRGIRVPLQIDVSPEKSEEATVSLSFAHEMQLSCAEQAQLAAEFSVLFDRARLRPPDHGSTADAYADTTQSGREAS